MNLFKTAKMNILVDLNNIQFSEITSNIFKIHPKMQALKILSLGAVVWLEIMWCILLKGKIILVTTITQWLITELNLKVSIIVLIFVFIDTTFVSRYTLKSEIFCLKWSNEKLTLKDPHDLFSIAVYELQLLCWITYLCTWKICNLI